MQSTSEADERAPAPPSRDDKERPKLPKQVTRLTLSNKLRRSISKEARADGDANKLWQAAGSLSSIHRQYARPGKPAAELEIDLHDLWFTYYHAARNTLADNPMLDRLVVQILQAREIGPLRRASPAAADTASTSDGVIWADLPFLAPDMTFFWLEDWARMSADNRLGLSTFLAKLASVGVCRDRLCGIGLVLLRDTLETMRPLGAVSSDDDDDDGTDSGKERSAENAARRPQDVTVAELLPAVNAWMFHAGYKVIQLADARWTGDDGALGPLLRADPSSSAMSAGGFSPERWIYWLKRMEQIAEEAESAGDARLGGLTRRYMDNMLAVVDEMDSAVKRLLKDSPGVIRHQPMVMEFGPK